MRRIRIHDERKLFRIHHLVYIWRGKELTLSTKETDALRMLEKEKGMESAYYPPDSSFLDSVFLEGYTADPCLLLNRYKMSYLDGHYVLVGNYHLEKGYYSVYSVSEEVDAILQAHDGQTTS